MDQDKQFAIDNLRGIAADLIARAKQHSGDAAALEAAMNWLARDAAVFAHEAEGMDRGDAEHAVDAEPDGVAGYEIPFAGRGPGNYGVR